MRITTNSQKKPNNPVQNLANQLQGASIIGKRTNTVYVGFTPKQMKESEKDKFTKTLPDMSKLKIAPTPKPTPRQISMHAKVREYCQKQGCNQYFTNKVMKYDEQKLRQSFPYLF
jgi:hypothetical protein